MPNFNPLQLALRPLIDKARAEDALFDLEVTEKETRAENPKSWEECCEYIQGEAYDYAKSHREGNTAMAGMSDDDLIGLIKHYYDEEEIVVKKMGAGTKMQVARQESEQEKKEREEREAKKKAEQEEKARIKAEKEAEKARKQAERDARANKDCGDMFSEFFS